MQKLKVDQTKLITQAEYAKKMRISPQLVTYHIQTGKVKSVKIIGTTLILLD